MSELKVYDGLRNVILNEINYNNKIMCIVGSKANIDLPAYTTVMVTGLNAIKDPYNMLQNDYIVIPKSGYYLIGYTMRLGDIGSTVDVFTQLKSDKSQLYRLCSMWQTQLNRLSPSQTAIVPLTKGEKLYLEITSWGADNIVYGGNNINGNGLYIFCKFLNE